MFACCCVISLSYAFIASVPDQYGSTVELILVRRRACANHKVIFRLSNRIPRLCSSVANALPVALMYAPAEVPLRLDPKGTTTIQLDPSRLSARCPQHR